MKEPSVPAKSSALKFGLSLHLRPYFVYVSSDGSFGSVCVCLCVSLKKKKKKKEKKKKIVYFKIPSCNNVHWSMY